MSWASELNRSVRTQAPPSSSNPWEANPLTGGLSVRLAPRLHNNTHLHNEPWALHQDHIHSLKRDGVGGMLMLSLQALMFAVKKTPVSAGAQSMGARSWHLLPVMPGLSCLHLFSVVPWLCSCEASVYILVAWVFVEIYILSSILHLSVDL